MPSLLNRIVSHTAALLIGSTSTILALRWLSHDDNGESRNDESTNLKSSSFILPRIKTPITIYNPNPNLQIAYDTRTKNPIYVMERLINKDSAKNESSNSNKGAKKQHYNFYEPKDLPEHHRPRNSYYRNSGYDRGHMAPAGNYRRSSTEETDLKDTYSLTNISPQNPIFNRHIWSRLEELVRQVSNDKGKANDETIVVTGPMWLPSKVIDSKSSTQSLQYEYQFVGLGIPPSIIQVPTHFYKVIYTITNKNVDDSDGKADHDDNFNHVKSFAAFVIPNESFVNNRFLNLEDYVVRLSDLEATTGLSVFPNMDEGYLEVFDLITEDFWIQRDVVVNNYSLVEGSVVVADSEGPQRAVSKISTKRRQRNDKKLKEIRKGCRGLVPNHICRDGSCKQLISIKQSNKQARG